MKRVGRVLLLCALAVIVLIGMGGCRDNQQDVNTIAIKRMEKKYGEKFTYSQPWGNSLSGTRRFLVTCDSLPGKQVLVEIENYREEDKIFRDNYLAVKYEDETVAFFKGFVDQVFGESVAFYTAAYKGLSPELTADASLEDFLADSRSLITVRIAIKESKYTSKEQLNVVADSIVSVCNADSIGVIIMVVKDDRYDGLDKDAFGDYVVFRDFVHCIRVQREDGEDLLIEWLGEE